MKALLLLLLLELAALGQAFTMQDAAFMGNAVPKAGSSSSLLTSLVAYWKFDETSGNRSDSAGANTLTQSGVVGSAAGKLGNCAVWTNNGADYLSIADNAALSMGQGVSFTVSWWLLNTATNTLMFYWSKGPDAAATCEYHSGFTTAAGYYAPYGRISDGTTLAAAYYNVKEDTNIWYHVALWYNAADSNLCIRVNDTSTVTNASNVYAQDGTQTLYIGKKSSGVPLNGKLDEMGIWKRVLTASEITELYNSGNGKTYPF